MRSDTCDKKSSETITCSHCGGETVTPSYHCPRCGIALELSSDDDRSTHVDLMGWLKFIIASVGNKSVALLSGMAKVVLFLIALGTALVGAIFPPIWILTTVLVLLLIYVTD